MSRALGIDAVMTKYKLDALVAANRRASVAHRPVKADSFLASAEAPSTVTSVAAIRTLPCLPGYSRIAGWGSHSSAARGSEATADQLAYAYEQATRQRRPRRSRQRRMCP